VIRETESDVLLFDLGGVLTDFAGFEELGPLLPHTPDPSTVRNMWIHSKSVQLFERGDITSEEFARRLVEEFHLEMSAEEFIREFVSWARGPYPGSISLLRRLKNTHRIACLSNSNELHTPLHRASIEPLMEKYYFSDELGLVKPNPDVFKFVIEDLNVPPERIAFFDDTPINVEAALDVGIIAYEVDGFAELTARLERVGVL